MASGTSKQQAVHNRVGLYALIVFVAGSSYGFIVPTVKVSVAHGVDPTEFLPLQYLFALVFCLAVALASRAKWPAPVSCAKMALLGVFTGCTSICYYSAVKLLPSAVALTMLFQYVWVGVLVECVAYRRPPAKSTVAAVAVVLVGTVFAAGLLEGTAGALDPVGVGLGLMSAVFYSLYLFFAGRICPHEAAPVRSTMLCVGGLVVTSLANPGCYATSFFDAGVWPYALLMGTLGVLFPTTLINFASPKLPAGMVPVMAASELPVGIFAAWAIVADRPSGLTLLGAFLVLAGIVVKQVPQLVVARREKTGTVEGERVLKEEKTALRKRLSGERAALGAEERASVDAALAEQVAVSAEFQAAQWVFTYLSVGAEVDTRAIIRRAWDAGKRVAIPRCVPHTRFMKWYEVRSFDGLETSSFGVEEPLEDPACEVDPAACEAALALVPGFTFDQEGFRLGYGGGFYDVFLSGFPGVAMGLCRSAFFGTVKVPRGEYDLPVALVATDQGVVKTR